MSVDSEAERDLRRKTIRATLATRVFVVVAIAFAVVVVGLLVRIATDTNRTVTKVSAKQNSNTPVLESINELAKNIRSCTDPAGACAKRGQDSTGKAISKINQYGLYVVTCADQPGQQTEAEIRACANRMAALAARTPSTR